MNNPVRKKFQFGNHSVELETGRIAKQSSGAVLVTMDGTTVVLCTVVAEKKARPGRDFFPLTVNYQEKTYAAGKIPGGFFRREGRPSEKEQLTSRLIDRPLRPLFPKGFMNEVQVICTVMSVDRDMDPDIASLIGASAALALSGIPFAGPIAAARVGFKDGTYLLNPTHSELKESALNMVIAGTRSAVLMVESEADQLTEDQMLGAALFGHQEMQVVLDAIDELAKEAAKPAWEVSPASENTELMSSIVGDFSDAIREAYGVNDKQERYSRLSEVRTQAVERFANEERSEEEVKDVFGRAERELVRENILSGEPRIDGRDLKTVRPISVEVGFLPKTHGSA